MNDEKLKTLEQIREFMAGTEGVTFSHQPDRDTRYQHIADVLCRLRYYALGKADRGLVLRYLERTTGYSRQQVTRLVRRYLDTGELKKRYKPPVNGFKSIICMATGVMNGWPLFPYLTCTTSGSGPATGTCVRTGKRPKEAVCP